MENKLSYSINSTPESRYRTVISKKAKIIGNVLFGKGCIVNPEAHIEAKDGLRITFGDFNIIEERV